MFTGIVTDVGTVRSAEQRGDLRLPIGTATTANVDLGASIACSGVCLTVVDKGDDWFAVDVSAETVSRPRPTCGGRARSSTSSARCAWATSSAAISSPAMSMRCGGRRPVAEGGSTRIGLFAAEGDWAMFAPKGSITLDGVSLTVNDVSDLDGRHDAFSVNIIPHTARGHDAGHARPGRQLNVEIDVIARYLQPDARRRAQ